jgi:hypothetical protein
MSKKGKMQVPQATEAVKAVTVPVATAATVTVATPGIMNAVAMPADGLTTEAVEKMTGAELIKHFGNKSNAIRGLAALGLKPGPISKKLGIIYQHARNVLKRPLKRVIKDERDAKVQEQSQAAPAAEGQTKAA